MSAATYSYGPYYTFKATYKSHYCELNFHYYLFVCLFFYNQFTFSHFCLYEVNDISYH